MTNHFWNEGVQSISSEAPFDFIERHRHHRRSPFRMEDIMKKRTMMIKVTATALAGVMALGMLTACGGSSDAETTTATADTTASTARRMPRK